MAWEGERENTGTVTGLHLPPQLLEESLPNIQDTEDTANCCSAAWRGTATKLQRGERRFWMSEDTRDPTPPKEGEIPTPETEEEEGEVVEIGKIVTTTDPPSCRSILELSLG
ncbi:uncharacterized protein LOC143925440 [Lithobates pipiens]